MLPAAPCLAPTFTCRSRVAQAAAAGGLADECMAPGEAVLAGADGVTVTVLVTVGPGLALDPQAVASTATQPRAAPASVRPAVRRAEFIPGLLLPERVGVPSPARTVCQFRHGYLAIRHDLRPDGISESPPSARWQTDTAARRARPAEDDRKSIKRHCCLSCWAPRTADACGQSLGAPRTTDACGQSLGAPRTTDACGQSLGAPPTRRRCPPKGGGLPGPGVAHAAEVTDGLALRR